MSTQEPTPLEKIRMRLAKVGSNLSELSRESGVSRNAFEYWKRKPYVLSDSTLQKIIPALERIEARNKANSTLIDKL